MIKMKKVSVLLPSNTNSTYDYLSPSSLELGTLVSVPFRNKEMKGIVWYDSSEDIPFEKLKKVKKVFNGIKLEKKLISFLDFFYKYNLVPISKLFKLVIPQDKSIEEISEKSYLGINTNIPSESSLKLTELQQNAANILKNSVKKNTFERFLIDGVTGSGKTEVYFEAVNEVVKKGNQVLILLPEISLVDSLVERVTERFGFEPYVWHSETKVAKKKKIWKDIYNGKAQLVIGARSSLFLPFKNLDLIIVDEEHDISYKQQDQIIYNARDMAIARGSFENSTTVLVSATPSLESLFNAKEKKYFHLNLPNRIGSAGMPYIKTIDMRKEKMEKDSWISPSLKSAMLETLESGEQVLLFINRRGYAPLTVCKSCGDKIGCSKCDSYLVHHKTKNKLLCHQCGYTEVFLDKCKSCKTENSFLQYGPGIERLLEETNKIFPDKSVSSISSDNSKDFLKTMESLSNGEIDIIIGTQIISKGYHLPNLTLVGVIDADIGLASSDLRASEHTFQLLQQVSGRSGRDEKEGKAFIQTYYPHHPVIHSLVNNSRDEFTEAELFMRERSELPPYGRLANITVTDTSEERLVNFNNYLKSLIPKSDRIKVFGPAPAPITKIRNRYRYKFLIKANKTLDIQKFIENWISGIKKPNSIRLSVDIDPYNFL